MNEKLYGPLKPTFGDDVVGKPDDRNDYVDTPQGKRLKGDLNGTQTRGPQTEPRVYEGENVLDPKD